MTAPVAPAWSSWERTFSMFAVMFDIGTRSLVSEGVIGVFVELIDVGRGVGIGLAHVLGIAHGLIKLAVELGAHHRPCHRAEV